MRLSTSEILKALPHTLTAAERVVFVELHELSFDGLVSPHIAQLARRSGYGQHTVLAVIARFRQMGVLKLVKPATRDTVNTYRLDWELLTVHGEGGLLAQADLEG